MRDFKVRLRGMVCGLAILAIGSTAVGSSGGLMGGFMGQGGPSQPIPGAFRFKIRHADPWFVKSLLEGNPTPFPEISTILGRMGGMAGAMTGQAVNTALANGRWFVNPTDNSLWFIPAKG